MPNLAIHRKILDIKCIKDPQPSRHDSPSSLHKIKDCDFLTPEPHFNSPILN